MMSKILRLPAKWFARKMADILLKLRGWRLPDYFDLQARLTVLFRGIEPDIINFSRRYLRPGMTVLDVGANVGLLARHFCRCVGDHGKVIAFEPEPVNARSLEWNLRSFPQAEVAPIALGSHDGTATLFLNHTSGTGNSLLRHTSEMQPIEVVMRSLDSFLQERADIRPDLVKIDVEGGESIVLAGMRGTLTRFPDVRLLVELCPRHLGGEAQASQLIDEFLSLGFTIDLIHNDGSLEPFRALAEHADAFAAHGYANLLLTKRPPDRDSRK